MQQEILAYNLYLIEFICFYLNLFLWISVVVAGKQEVVLCMYIVLSTVPNSSSNSTAQVMLSFSLKHTDFY